MFHFNDYVLFNFDGYLQLDIDVYFHVHVDVDILNVEGFFHGETTNTPCAQSEVWTPCPHRALSVALALI